MSEAFLFFLFLWAFLSALSLLVNVVLAIFSGGCVWYTNRTIKENIKFSDRIVELEQITESVGNLELFFHEISELEILLKDLREKELFVTDPDLEEVHIRLMSILNTIEGA